MKFKGIIIIAILLFVSCVKKVGNKDISFDTQILPIFVSNCTMSGCHDGQSKRVRYNFTTYEGIMEGVVAYHPLRSEVYKTTRGNNPSMPLSPYPKLSAKNVELIKLWINMGAPKTSIEGQCDTLAVTFNKTIQPILNTWCVGCHSNSNASGGIELSTYNGAKAATTNNKLLGSIKYLNGFVKMPQNSNQLSACDIAKIEKWLREGAANN